MFKRCRNAGITILLPLILEFHSRALQIIEASGMRQRVGVVRLSRRAHNPETGGSNPPSATKKMKVKNEVLLGNK